MGIGVGGSTGRSAAGGVRLAPSEGPTTGEGPASPWSGGAWWNSRSNSPPFEAMASATSWMASTMTRPASKVRSTTSWAARSRSSTRARARGPGRSAADFSAGPVRPVSRGVALSIPISPTHVGASRPARLMNGSLARIQEDLRSKAQPARDRPITEKEGRDTLDCGQAAGHIPASPP
jgi:hypothetical protein